MPLGCACNLAVLGLSSPSSTPWRYQTRPDRITENLAAEHAPVRQSSVQGTLDAGEARNTRSSQLLTGHFARRACCLSLLTLLPRPALAAGSRAGSEQAYNGCAESQGGSHLVLACQWSLVTALLPCKFPAAQLPVRDQAPMMASHPSSAGPCPCLHRYAPRYDELNAGPLARAVGFDELRASLLAQASGSVLEVAVGTGLNLPLYDWQQVKSVRAVDLSGGMLAQAQARITALPSLQTHQDDITLSQAPLSDPCIQCQPGCSSGGKLLLLPQAQGPERMHTMRPTLSQVFHKHSDVIKAP
ncbi:methyltransf_11 domain-containing protein [Haematococcus lacustris]|uniref:Methyltransf_11 domain-containing protein n=1 Tax=Haematococcus lacustris TaxID=44745 RepID=A0A699ZZU6_HAELA|nr:methyltransf_11 domain-containing protein [Haematococcus lacustris]